MLVLGGLLGAGAGGRAPQAYQRRAPSRVPEALRALPGAGLAGVAAVAGRDARAGAALGGDLHQRRYGEYRGEPARLAGGRADRAAAAAARAAARMGRGRLRPGGGADGLRT